MKAACRVYLFTYKRNHLLKRAIDSLINQTYKNWICELHNDDPSDTFPEEYLRQLNDHRFLIKNHDVNLGGTDSFNLAFAGCTEKYASILEDDNWWEPAFLETIIGTMDREPGISVAWSNMKIWREANNGDWIDTKRTIWNDNADDKAFISPHIKQAMGALHSNGAMLYLGNEASRYLIPSNCELSIIEPVRERLFKLPIYFINEPLANFSLTIHSSRSRQKWIWTSCQAMLLSSFIEASTNQQQTFKDLLAHYRKQQPSPLSNFFIAVLFLLKRPALFKFFNLNDWLTVNKWLIKNAFNLSKINKYLKSQQNVYQFLLVNTAKQHQSNAS